MTSGGNNILMISPKLYQPEKITTKIYREDFSRFLVRGRTGRIS